tara:strand:+ start:818 stop:1390 length:573 start_codon:yes stop_codon:yes gene_type:complete
MASGPNLTIPSGGDALNATDIGNNFTAVRDFLSAMPVDNLSLYYCPNQFGGQTMSAGPANTQTWYGQYFKPNQSGTDATTGKYLEACFWMSGLPDHASDSITITLQEEDSAGANTYSDVSGAALTVNSATASRTADGTSVAVAVEDAFSLHLDSTKWYRFKWANSTGSGTARTLTNCQASVWGRTKLQGV